MRNTLQFHSSTLLFGHLGETGFNELLEKRYPGSRFIVLTDENVAGYWMEYMLTGFPALSEAEIIELPAGEESKNIENCISIWEALSEYNITRQDVIINLGGGVITDLGGFIASTYKRGLRFINIPTTLLAQVDASLGGKTGIDLGPHKNQVGVFSDADLVFIDPRFLATLPREQLYSGFAEMLKHGLIADAEYWHELVKSSPEDLPALLPLIHRSVAIKKGIVEQDYEDTGIRRGLNFGHTIGHAIEGYFLHRQSPVLHGYAVAWGMMVEACLSVRLSLLPEEKFREIRSVLIRFFGTPDLPDTAVMSIKHLVKNDKKNAPGRINFVLLREIGTTEIDQQVHEDNIPEALREAFVKD